MKIPLMAHAIAGTALSLTGVLLCLFALDRTGWRIQLGDLGTWVGGLGSAAAAFAAFVTLRELLKARQAETTDARERALRRASRIHVSARPTFVTDLNLDDHFVGWRIEAKNDSDRPIYDLKFEIPIAVAERSEPLATRHFAWGDEPSVGDIFPSVEPGKKESCVVTVRDTAEEFSDPEKHQVIPFVEFTDDDGYSFCLDYTVDFRGIRPPRWAIKDSRRAHYPKDAGLDEYFEAAGAAHLRLPPDPAKVVAPDDTESSV